MNRKIRKAVLSERFDGFFGFIVGLNTLTMGIEYAKSEKEWGVDAMVRGFFWEVWEI